MSVDRFDIGVTRRASRLSAEDQEALARFRALTARIGGSVGRGEEPPPSGDFADLLDRLDERARRGGVAPNEPEPGAPEFDDTGLDESRRDESRRDETGEQREPGPGDAGPLRADRRT